MAHILQMHLRHPRDDDLCVFRMFFPGYILGSIGFVDKVSESVGVSVSFPKFRLLFGPVFCVCTKKLNA